MAWNGSGTFSRSNGVYTGTTVWQQDLANAVDIEADRHDTHDQDLAAGINACLAKNGENAMTGDLAMGGNDILNAGAIAATSLAVSGALTINGATAISYARTAEEIAAGVTPTSYLYPPGDIRRYGCVIDGATDDTAAWADACSIGIDLLHPGGTTLVDPDTIALQSGTTLRGMGQSSIIKANSAGKIIKNENWGTTTEDQRINIRDLVVDCTGLSGTSVPTIALKHVSRCNVLNVTVIDAPSQAILIAGLYTGGTHYPSKYVTVAHCLVDGSAGTGVTFFGETKFCRSIGNTVIDHEDDAFAFDAEASAACYGNKSIGDTSYNGIENDPAAGGRGIEIGGQINFVCSGFSCNGLASSGIVLEYGTGGSTPCSNVTINGFNIVDAGTLDVDADSIGYGINIGRVDGLTLSSGRVSGSQDNGVHVASTALNVSIDNVTCVGNGGHGINVTAPGTTVTDCQCYNNQWHGIFVNNADYVEVVSNRCNGNGIDSGASYSGIKCQDSDYVLVNHNHAWDDGTPTQNEGVYLTNCDYGDASFNLCHGNVDDQFLPQNHASLTDCNNLTMRGNIVDPASPMKGKGTISSGQANVTITNGNVMLGSIINITPTNATMAAAVGAANGMYITKLNLTSFTVTLTSAVGADATFDWSID